MVADWKVSAITACPDTRRLQTDLGVLSLFALKLQVVIYNPIQF